MSTELPELLLEGRDREISSDNAGNSADGKDLGIDLGVLLEFKFVFRFSIIPLFLCLKLNGVSITLKLHVSSIRR